MSDNDSSISRCNLATAAKVIVAECPTERWTDLDCDELKKDFRESGAILFRGFRADIDALTAFTDLFCHDYMINPKAGRNPVASDKKVETVNVGHRAFELHAERHQLPFSPHICFFYCEEAPERHGETTYCDGSALIARLSESTRKALRKRKLRYDNIADPEVLAAAFGVDVDKESIRQAIEDKALTDFYQFTSNRIIQRYQVPFFGKSRFSGREAFVSYLLFNRYTRGERHYPTFENSEVIPDRVSDEIRERAAEITVSHRWKKHDLLMLDNTRFMHGRNRIDPADRRLILTRFGYANFE